MPTLLITGGNRGLANATIKHLLRIPPRGNRTFDKIVFTVRNASDGEAARAEFEAIRPGVAAFVVLDLASFASVREVAERLIVEKIHVVFLCAGVMQQSPTRRVTPRDGLEETLEVNALSPLLLATLLLRDRDNAPTPIERIVTVTSRLHFPGTRGDPVHFDFDEVCIDPESGAGKGGS